MASRVDQRELRGFGHMERMDAYRMAMIEGVDIGSSFRACRGRPRFCWMDGAKVTFSNDDGGGNARKIRSGEP